MLSRTNFTLKKFFMMLRSSYIYILLFVIYVPLIFLVALSFNGESSRGNIVSDFTNPNFDNYINLFSNDEFVNAFLNSLLVAVVVAPVATMIAVFTSFGLWYSNNQKLKKTIQNVNGVNLSLPDIIYGISLAILFTAFWIPLGFDFGFTTVVLSHIAFSVPYAIIAIYPKMLKFNKNLINASNDLGASKSKTFFKIVLPFLTPAIISAFIIVTAISFDDYIITLLVSGNFVTISTEIFQSAKGIKAWIVTFGAILVLGFISITIITVMLKSLRSKAKARILIDDKNNGKTIQTNRFLKLSFSKFFKNKRRGANQWN